VTNEQRREQLFGEVQRHLKNLRPLALEYSELKRLEADDPEDVPKVPDPEFVAVFEEVEQQLKGVLLPA
jgi:hypothetical protein